MSELRVVAADAGYGRQCSVFPYRWADRLLCAVFPFRWADRVLRLYTGLALPLVISPTIGSQEKFNRNWLMELGYEMRQKNPEHSGEWLFDVLQNGWFADIAWLGFLCARKPGMYHILDGLQHRTIERSDNPLQR